MNKQFPLLILIIFSVSFGVKAQEYQMIFPEKNQYFYTTEVDQIPGGETDVPQLLGIRVDSVRTEDGNEVYYFPKYLRLNPDNASQICPGSSWMGPKAVHKSDGATIFFNKDNDSIIFYPGKGENESWIIYMFPDSTYLEATVTEITGALFEYDLIIELKYITLQAKDKENNPIDHAFNGKQFIIGEHFGLFQTYDLYNFPEKNLELNSYYLVSAEPHNPGYCYISYQDNVPHEFFKYKIGDEFHYYGEWKVGATNHGHEKSKQKVLSKKLSSNLDTVTYTYSIEVFTMSSNYDLSTQQTTVDENYVKDTFDVKYVFSELAYLAKLPFEPIYDSLNDDGERYGYTQCIYRYDTLIKKTNFNYSFENDCFVPYLDYSGFDELISGLGNYYSYSNDGNFETSYKLVYHKSGNEEWGTPLVLDRKEASANSIGFSVYPIPASNHLTIELAKDGKYNVEITLISALGERVFSTVSTAQSPIQLSLPEVQKGLYLLEVKAKDSNAISRKSIVIE